MKVNNSNKNNITLIGMPGSGKSTLGVVAAKMLNMKFLDVDLLIQDTCGCTLPVLINRLGVEGFIERESQIIQSITTSAPTVISTGGSAVYTQGAMQHLREIGRLVYLHISYEELVGRMGADTLEARGVVLRDLAGSCAGASESASVQSDVKANDKPVDGLIQLKDVYDQRIPLYEKYADITLDVDGLDVGVAATRLSAVLYE